LDANPENEAAAETMVIMSAFSDFEYMLNGGVFVVSFGSEGASPAVSGDFVETSL